MAVFSKILVANRGEIACRVIRACAALGVPAVAVYSEADRDAPHVSMADEAVLIGPAPAQASYLNTEQLLTIAQRMRVDAIHPGYGFLSENAAFAKECLAQGISFIGPSPEVIAAMGRKPEARALMAAAGLPTVPGSAGDLTEDKEALSEAERIGYPVLVKASAGGGGMGMSVARSPEQLLAAVANARSRGQRSFGDGGVFLERLLERPRHIEVQVFGDQLGNVVHLLERECSVQRRYQKVIEEAPSPRVDSATRERIASVAVRAARAVGYSNAGTIEGLLDSVGSYYFLEMNTRLQVEHPVTEMVTGIDLVQAQIRVAGGEPLPWRQSDVKLHGHAIECRIYAEDPVTFLPAPGTLRHYVEPTGEGIRVDSGVRTGSELSVFYDPLIAKLIAHGSTRSESLARLASALTAFEIEGVKTNIPALQRVLDDRSFQTGDYDTSILTGISTTAVRA